MLNNTSKEKYNRCLTMWSHRMWIVYNSFFSCSVYFSADGQSFSAYHPFFNGNFSFSVFIRGQVVEGFPLDINVGDIRPRVRSAKRAIAGSGSKFGKLGDPQGVAVSEDGNVIVSDSRNHRLQVSKAH